MERYRCNNPKCNQPVLFEGNFIGTVKKICPKCKIMNVFTKKLNNNIEKFCITEN
jgi:phage FluMu protein Com